MGQIESGSELEERDFKVFKPETQQLIWAVAGNPLPETSQPIIYLADNLRLSPLVIEAAGKLLKNQALIIRWVDWLTLLLMECLQHYHQETYLHVLRVRSIVRAIRQMLAKYGIEGIPNYGNADFQKIQENFIMTDKDWERLEFASWFHDLGKMAYPQKFWNTAGKFTDDQRKELEAHARLFYYLGEMFNVPQIVSGLSVLHHYPNLHYPQNGVVMRYKDLMGQKKFRQLLRMLITMDIYEAMSGIRTYRPKIQSHQETIQKMPGELRKVGTGYIPLLEALKESLPGDRLCAN